MAVTLYGIIGIVATIMAECKTVRQALAAGLAGPGLLASFQSGLPTENKPQSQISTPSSGSPLHSSSVGYLNLFQKAYAQTQPSEASKRTMVADAIIPIQLIRLTGTQMILEPVPNPLQIYNHFGLGSNVIVNNVPKGKIFRVSSVGVSGNISAPDEDSDFKLCIIGVKVETSNKIAAALGFNRDLQLENFQASAFSAEHVCQDTPLNAMFSVFTQYRVDQGSDSPKAKSFASSLQETISSAKFQAPAVEWKDYVGTYPSVPKNVVVYWYTNDSLAARKVAETANAWIKSTAPALEPFQTSDQTSNPYNHQPGEISLQMLIPNSLLE